MIVALAGGVGGAKLLEGLKLAGLSDTTAIVNTADDFNHLGLYICPDLDTVVYTLSGVVNRVEGWGRADESWHFLETLGTLNGPTWFRLGDKDLAVHHERTRRLASGETLAEITSDFAARLGAGIRVFPMSNDPVRTRVRTPDGWLDFQDYFVRHRCEPVVEEIAFQGVEAATACPQALSALEGEVDVLLICPSNPFVSIDPILRVPGLRQAVRRLKAPRVAISPIVGGKALKGPAAKMFGELGQEPSSATVAERYKDFIDGIVIDESDRHEASRITDLGIEVLVTASVMKTIEDRARLARETVEFAAGIGAGRRAS